MLGRLSFAHLPPPEHTLAALRERHGPRYRWLLLLTVMVGTMASVMSSTIINVGIPDMSLHFGLGQDQAQWVTSGFMAAMTVSMLTTPWLLTRLGYRTTYSACMLLLLVGGVAGGLATSYGLVLVARVAEGLAAGVVQPIPAIIILRAFEPHEQGRASGVFGMGVVLAPALGPSVGGLLVEWWGWRSLFYMVVPLCLLSLALARRFVPVTAPGGAAAGGHGGRLDWLGLALVTAGTLCLLNGLVALQGSSSTSIGLLLGAALVLVVAFLALQRHTLHQRRAHPAQGHDPLMNLSLFVERRFAMGSVVSFIYGVALFGSTYLLPVYMQLGLGLSPALVGAILLPAGLVLAVSIALVGRMADRRPPHQLVSTGLLLLAASFVLMLTPAWAPPQLVLPLLVAWAMLGRLGLGFILPSLNLGALRGTSPALIPQGASTINFLRMLGGATGVSLCGVVLEWRMAVHAASLHGTGSPAARLAAFNDTFLALSAVCGLALVAAWRMRARQHPGAVV